MCFSTHNHSLVVMEHLPQYAQNYLKLIPSCQSHYYYFPVDLLSYSSKSGPFLGHDEMPPDVKSLEEFESIKIYIDEKTATTLSVQGSDQPCPSGFQFGDLLLTRDCRAYRGHKYSLHTQYYIVPEFQMFYYEVIITSSCPNLTWYVQSCTNGIISSLCIDVAPHQHYRDRVSKSHEACYLIPIKTLHM